MLLLHVYSPEGRDSERQAPTWRALSECEPELLRRGWRIRHVPTANDSSYETVLRTVWGLDDLVLVEHDMVPTLDMLLHLEACPEAACAQAYRLHFASETVQAIDWLKGKVPQMDEESMAVLRGLNIDLDALTARYAHRRPDMHGRCWEPFCHRVRLEDGGTRWGTIDDRWADYAGFGLSRFSAAFQREHPAGWEPGKWGDLDGRVCVWMSSFGARWHIHAPECKHNHPCAEASWVGEAVGWAGVRQEGRPEGLAVLASLPAAQQVRSELEQAMDMVADLRPATVLEVGVAQGGTLGRWALGAADDALLIGVDARPPEHIPHRAGQTLRLLAADSHTPEALAAIRAELGDRPVDFLFIDGDHSAAGVRADFEAFAPLVRPGGIVAFHDICRHPDRNLSAVDEVWADLRGRYRHREIIEDPQQGWAGIGVLYV